MFELNLDLSIRKQANLLNVPRTKLYYKPIMNDDSEIANLIREIYLSSDCRYGYRKVTAGLRHQGRAVNSKKVLSIMQEMGIQGNLRWSVKAKSICTSAKNNEHKIYPYLLADSEINKINQVLGDRV